jgi:FKBP-type peptidyl-prolyl cis-trans isomerase FkpA
LKTITRMLVTAVAIAAASCSDDPTSPVDELEIIEVAVGSGAEALNGRLLTVHYTGYLYSESAPGHRGERFDSSVLRNQPFSFTLGVSNVIEGWHLGFVGMRAGGRRTLIIPPELGYGSRGSGPIPGNAALVFDVELLNVQ